MPFSPQENVLKQNEMFTCQKCGSCCQGYGGTYLTDGDIQKIAAYIHTDPENFLEKFCQMSGNRPVLTQQENGFCVFWDEVCTIHPVKPRMCRDWPFITSVLIDPSNWAIMASACPGIQIHAPIHQVQAHIRKLHEK